MSDIIERLENCTGLAADFYEDEIREAIAEIERLRALVKKYEDEQCAACRAYRESEARRGLAFREDLRTKP